MEFLLIIIFFYIFESFHQCIFVCMFCHSLSFLKDYMYKYTALYIHIYIGLGLRLNESIKCVRYLNWSSLFLRASVLVSREQYLFFLIPERRQGKYSNNFLKLNVENDMLTYRSTQKDMVFKVQFHKYKDELYARVKNTTYLIRLQPMN